MRGPRFAGVNQHKRVTDVQSMTLKLAIGALGFGQLSTVQQGSMTLFRHRTHPVTDVKGYEVVFMGEESGGREI